VTQLFESLRCKPEGRRFDSNSRWSHWDFSLTSFFRQPYGFGIDSASMRNENQASSLGRKDGRCVELKTMPPSCANCMEILGASTFFSLKGLYGNVPFTCTSLR
jgi:hypothetical protein